MRFTSILVRGVLMSAVVATPLLGQRSRRYSDTPDPDRAIQDWLDQCRDRHNSDRERFCEVREKRMDGTRGLDVDGRENGGVTVHGWDRSEVRVLAKIQAEGDDMDEARDVASQIDIVTDNGRVRAEGPSTRRHQSWSVSYEVWAPRQSDLHLTTHNGGISVEDVDGRLDLSALNGGIALRGVSGDVHGETTNGPLNVTLDGDRWRGPGLDLRTTNGPVNLDIPDGYSAHLETGTVNGGMRIDFPVTLQGNIGRRITTDIGNGGPPIRAVTTNGPVNIRRR
jgi:DUF4097 and DUF4098 domain-containing protein YvlB